MDDISSREDEVSSMEAACSEALSARNRLDAETCSDVDDTWSDFSFKPSMMWPRDLVMPLAINMPMKRPKTRPERERMVITLTPDFSSCFALMDVSLVNFSTFSMNPLSSSFRFSASVPTFSAGSLASCSIFLRIAANARFTCSS